MNRSPWIPLMCVASLLAAAMPCRAADASAVQVQARKKRQVLFAPAGFEKVVLLKIQGKEYKYYQFSLATPLKLEIAGPTSLEISVRLLYEVAMKGIQEYALKIEEEGLLGKRTEVGSHNLKAVKSTIATLKDQNQVVPSKARTLNLAVPKGKHTYFIQLKAAQAKTALIRIMIPKQDLKGKTRKEKNK